MYVLFLLGACWKQEAQNTGPPRTRAQIPYENVYKICVVLFPLADEPAHLSSAVATFGYALPSAFDHTSRTSVSADELASQ
jgi:hypothetical protein